MKVKKLLMISFLLTGLTFGAYAQEDPGSQDDTVSNGVVVDNQDNSSSISIDQNDSDPDKVDAPFSLETHGVLNSGQMNFGGTIEVPLKFAGTKDDFLKQLSAKVGVVAGPTLFKLSAGATQNLGELFDTDFSVEYIIVDIDSTNKDAVDPQDRHFHMELPSVNFILGNEKEGYLKLGVGIGSAVKDPLDGDVIVSFGRTNLGLFYPILEREIGKTKARLAFYGEGSIARNGDDRYTSSVVADLDLGLKGTVDISRRLSAHAKLGVYNTWGSGAFNFINAGNSDVRAEVGLRYNFGR